MANPLAKQRHETDAQYRTRMALADLGKRDKSESIVNRFAVANGDYRKEFVTHVEDNTKVQTIVNRGGSALDRWYASNKLSQSQIAAIHLCLRLWRLAGRNDRVTANYGERLGGGASAEHRANSEIEAREDLHRIQDYFPGSLRTYWGVFENICRHDMRADLAGSVLSKSGRTADARAHQVVCFVADIVAMKEGL